MKTQTPFEIHETIEISGKSPDRDIRYVRDIKPGQHVRQGDVYLLCVGKRPKCYATKTENRQLAPGTSKGSRHVAEGVITWSFAVEAEAREAIARLPGTVRSRLVLPGPCIEAGERFTVSHPEHAHHSLPAGCYIVLYQLDPRSMRRVED